MDVLDKGYVRLVDVMGSDLSVVNAARVSFARESSEFDERDERLIKFLAREGHTSPFRHAMATFEVKAPLMVARQWWKYVVGSDHTMDGWNEVSRRYVDEKPEFYIPDVWRAAPDNKKQGSGGPVSMELTEAFNRKLEEVIELGMRYYREALDAGIAPEQARLLLPAYGMYTVWRWSASLQSICHFLNQRLAPDAQWEIREYAKAVEKLIRPRFPVSVAALLGGV
ncbi:MAG: FAD-dependent thymidylate synthase [Clostridia bacterium]